MTPPLPAKSILKGAYRRRTLADYSPGAFPTLSGHFPPFPARFPNHRWGASFNRKLEENRAENEYLR